MPAGWAYKGAIFAKIFPHLGYGQDFENLFANLTPSKPIMNHQGFQRCPYIYEKEGRGKRYDIGRGIADLYQRSRRGALL